MCCSDGWRWVSVSARGDKKCYYECQGGTRGVGGETEKRELEQIRQMIRAISQSVNASDSGKCYFLPVQLESRVGEGSRV